MPSKIAALALTAGLTLPMSSVPNYTAIDQIPGVGQPFVQPTTSCRLKYETPSVYRCR